MKENRDDDGFLIWLHVLILMDDTVLLSTTRERIISKLSLLKQFCDEYGMKVNAAKTKFFFINGTLEDNETVFMNGLVVERCDYYIYSGSPFTVDADVKVAQVIKFISFLRKNNDIPFRVKKILFVCLM